MKLINYISAYLYKIANLNKARFLCPICGYYGPFKDYTWQWFSEHYNCPRCFSAARHRLQYLTVKKLSEQFVFSEKILLHFAPETCMRDFLSTVFGVYHTSDISAKGVECIADLCNLPFKDQSCHTVFASHVMEHIHDDYSALKEIRRILMPGGMAILPVPVFGPYTIDYPERNPHEYNHVRAPGLDYFKRYEAVFSEVQIFSSNDFPEKYQTFLYEDRENWPDTMPLRPKSKGKKHADFVPVCFK